jgi:cob(I)alamin adenosyltransferase
MKIYTGKGDNGTAGLLSGERVPKSHERIDAIGDIDELTSSLGLLRVNLPKENEEIGKEIKRIQSDLLYVGALISTWRDAPVLKKLKQINKEHIDFLEAAIDRVDQKMPPLEHFILPDGHPAAAWAHFARTICRRTERHIVRLSVEIKVGKHPKLLRWVIIYLNRLSDYLYVVGRYCNYLAGIADDVWKM